MQSINTALLIQRASDYDTPLCQVIRKAVEVGVVVPSRLRAELAAAGFLVNEDEDDHATNHGYRTLEHLYRVLVHDRSGAVVAMGASHDTTDALLHAMLGYVRERDVEAHGSILPLRV